MQRLFNIDKWKRLEDGTAVNFGNTNSRRVRLDVNSAGPCWVAHTDANGNTTLLGKVDGRDVLEFATPGEFALTVDGADLWFYTIDGENFSFSIPDADSFTKIIERRPRNHQLELMMYLQNQNMERRLADQREELAQLLDRRQQASAASAAQPAPAGDGTNGPGEPAAAGTDASAGNVAPADAGSGNATPA